MKRSMQKGFTLIELMIVVFWLLWPCRLTRTTRFVLV